MQISRDDFLNLATGSQFLACSVDTDWLREAVDRVEWQLAAGDALPALIDADDLPDDAHVLSVGFVNNGLPPSDLYPVGDEFVRSVRALERELGVRFAGLIPLAGANINVIVALHTAMDLGIPLIDSDQMGRVFSLLHQSVFTLAELPAGPLAVTGATGESAVLQVTAPIRAERLVRALAGELGGWAASALYPMRAATLKAHGLHGTLSRNTRIGRILNSDAAVAEKYQRLTAEEGVRRIIHARVTDVTGLSRPAPPGEPDRPSSVILEEIGSGRIVQLEIQNELLMLMVDGMVEAVMPDIITMLDPQTASVASFEDLWVGHRLDLMVLRAAPAWYTTEGIELVGPDAHHIMLRDRKRKQS